MLPSDYLESRQRFRMLAEGQGAAPQAFLHDGAEDGGVQLSTDVAYLGPPDAQTIVVIASGTHGVEGYGLFAKRRGGRETLFDIATWEATKAGVSLCMRYTSRAAGFFEENVFRGVFSAHSYSESPLFPQFRMEMQTIGTFEVVVDER